MAMNRLRILRKSALGSVTLESVLWVTTALVIIAMFVEFMVVMNKWQTLDNAKWAALKVIEQEGQLTPEAEALIQNIMQDVHDAEMPISTALEIEVMIDPNTDGSAPSVAPYGRGIALLITYDTSITNFGGWQKSLLPIRLKSYGKTTSEYVP
jgi:Flp pilus assembly protein TadG